MYHDAFFAAGTPDMRSRVDRGVGSRFRVLNIIRSWTWSIGRIRQLCGVSNGGKMYMLGVDAIGSTRVFDDTDFVPSRLLEKIKL